MEQRNTSHPKRRERRILRGTRSCTSTDVCHELLGPIQECGLLLVRQMHREKTSMEPQFKRGDGQDEVIADC
jgi:hypothetical protein